MLAPSVTSADGSSIIPTPSPTPGPQPGPDPEPDPDKPGHKGNEAKFTILEILGISAGGIIFLIIIVALIVYCITRERLSEEEKDARLDRMREELSSPEISRVSHGLKLNSTSSNDVPVRIVK